jgi:hypothetical protein
LSEIQYADDCIYKGYGGNVDYLDQVLDQYYSHSGESVLNFDFNVNDILCQLKFKYVNNIVNNCSVCSYLSASSIHNIHHSFGFLNLTPLTISSNIQGAPIAPTFANYLSVQNLFNGFPNFISKIAPIASHINVNLFRELARGFHDQQIFDLITYGFPLDLDKPNFIPNSAVTNHGSAFNFPSEVDNYFREEIHLGSIFGLFPVPPLTGLHCSPLMTPPKDGTKRRIIVDLSYPSPHSHSVNISVSKTQYVGTPFILK